MVPVMDIQAILEENARLISLNKELTTSNKKLESSNKNLNDTKSKLQTKVQELERLVATLQILHFGPKSEKLDPEDKTQARLFNEAEDGSFSQNDPEQIESATETTTVQSHSRKTSSKAGRIAISDDLPREETVYDLDESQKVCACGTEKTCIGTDASERVEIIPSKIVVKRELRKKYVCKSCEGTSADEKGVITAGGPKHLIPRSIAGEGFLAWSIAEKYEFSLPFYRQEKRFGYIGLKISRATLCNLAIQAAGKCEVLYNLIKEHIVGGEIINADETRTQVLKEPGRSAQSRSWMWVFLGGPPNKKAVIFHYDSSRGSKIPKEFLEDFSGYLQSDDYGVYKTVIQALSENQITHVLCWAHARRKFKQAWDIEQSKESKIILNSISQLFDLEELRDKYSKKGFLKQRKNRAGPIFDELKSFLMVTFEKTPPRSTLGQAISYTLDNWEELIRYVDHSDLTPSNNSAENAIRPFVIGRKNFLFSTSTQGAHASAILYSLIESAKLNGLSPLLYLHYIFTKIPYAERSEDYIKLLPMNVSQDELMKFSQVG
jgi:transposase